MNIKNEFVEFIATVREGEKTGEVKMSKAITDFDLSVIFAIGKLTERGIMKITQEDLGREMTIQCGEDVWQCTGDKANQLSHTLGYKTRRTK